MGRLTGILVDGEKLVSYEVTEENDKTEEQKPIKPIPNYYSLIFIMKL